MECVKVYKQQDILSLTRKRSGEIKIGEAVDFVKSNWKEDLQKSSATFVILGIAEDIGVRGNYGRGGAHTAFKPALDSFLSQQSNTFMKAEDVFVLGEIFVDDLMQQSADLDTKNKEQLQKLRDLCALVDERVVQTVQFIVALGKIPILIGGGHNNAYGAIKGSSLALQKKINVINCDPHLDFRPLEGRHSGNGFSYAFHEGYMNAYAVFAMHEQYNNREALQEFKNNSTQLFFNTYESVFVREELSLSTAIKQAIGLVKSQACGIEVDLDAITNVPSSAKTSSGISPVQARQYVHRCASNLQALYFHIAEGAPILSHIKADNKTGKLIAYLATDFIKAVQLKG